MPPRLLALLLAAIAFALLTLASCSPAVKVARHYRHFAKSAPRQSQRPLRLVLGLGLLMLASCSPRVYWPQSPNQRPARAARGVVQITTLEEGRDYQGWSPAPTKCQQQSFPFHLSKK